MQNFIRIPETILRDINLNPTHKLIIGYLHTYQSKPDDSPTDNYYYNNQENLSIELGIPLRSLKRAISELTDMKLIFQAPKSDYDGKPQFKSRKAIVLVDDNNPFQSKSKRDDLSHDNLEVYIEPISIENVENNPMPEPEIEVIEEVSISTLMTVEEYNRRTSYKIENQTMVGLVVGWINKGSHSYEDTLDGWKLNPEDIVK